MNNALYFISYEENDVSCLEVLSNLLQNAFGNVAIFKPIGDEESSLINFENFCNTLDNTKDLELSIISRYEELASSNKSVIVIGDKNLHTFNDKIAKNLNIPIVFNEKSKPEIYKYEFEEILNAQTLAYIKEGNLYFTKSKKRVSMDIAHIKPEIFKNELESLSLDIVTPVKFEYSLYKEAKKSEKTIVLPESDDERVLKAADILLNKKALNIILLGDEKLIKVKAKELGLNLLGAKFIDPQTSSLKDEFATRFYNLRKEKGVTLEKAKEIVKERNYFASMLALLDMADGVVSGAVGTTADTIRPAFEIIKTRRDIKSVSGAFFICLDDRVHVYADCAIIPNPTSENLAQIATMTAQSASAFCIDPKVAMLSYSSGDSGTGRSVDLVKEALYIAKNELGDKVDGPMQFDTAVCQNVAVKKMPNSLVAGKANVFIFPDLNSGNITYKAVQRSAKAVAIGPILQGLKKPVNDLSRGCLVEDIVSTVLVTAIQANSNKGS
ncbi:MAG: phosphate acetyltransferase [Campylobacter sp.]|nr:phosphate acetyltransferase [Campylobacter sp.]